MFEDDRKKDADGWLQTLLYCEALTGKTAVEKLRPSVYRIKKNSAGPDSDKLRIKTGNKGGDCCGRLHRGQGSFYCGSERDCQPYLQ